jgi:plasmid stability protein
MFSMVISLLSFFRQSQENGVMANLIVRKLDPRIVDALKQRAARHGRSAEAEHRALLESVLLQPARKSFAEALAAMPNVGRDEDFERIEDVTRSRRVFD